MFACFIRQKALCRIVIESHFLFLPIGITSADESIFKYDDGLSHADFSHQQFVPIYLDEIDPAQRQEARSLCGDNTQCVYDFVVTGNRDVANQTLQTTQEEHLIDILTCE